VVSWVEWLTRGVAMMQPSRLAAVRDRCKMMARERGISEEMVERIYESVFAESCRLEDEIIARRRGEKGRPCVS